MLLKTASILAYLAGLAAPMYQVQFGYHVYCEHLLQSTASTSKKTLYWHSTEQSRERYERLDASLSGRYGNGLIKASVSAAMSKVSRAASSSKMSSREENAEKVVFQPGMLQVFRKCVEKVIIDGQTIEQTSKEWVRAVPEKDPRALDDHHWQQQAINYINTVIAPPLGSKRITVDHNAMYQQLKANLRGTCAESAYAEDKRLKFNICPFDRVDNKAVANVFLAQNSGRFVDQPQYYWDGPDMRQALPNGDPASNCETSDKKRFTEIIFVCTKNAAKDNTVSDFTQPKTCHYRVYFFTKHACPSTNTRGAALLIDYSVDIARNDGWHAIPQIVDVVGSDLEKKEWGTWSDHMCPPDSYVSAISVRDDYAGTSDTGGWSSHRFSGGGSYDDTGLNGVRMTCQKIVGKRNGKVLMDFRQRQNVESTGFFGEWSNPQICSDGAFVTALKVRMEEKQGGKDDTAINGMHMACTWSTYFIGSGPGDYGQKMSYPKHYYGTNLISGWTMNAPGTQHHTVADNSNYGPMGNWQLCPSRYYMCGHKARMERSKQGRHGDDVGLTDIKMICCRMPWDGN